MYAILYEQIEYGVSRHKDSNNSILHVNINKYLKYQGVEELHMLAHRREFTIHYS